jgi:ubiquinone biosynthesis protein Coq4
LPVFLIHRLALPLLMKIRKPEHFPYTVEALQQFPVNSMGFDLVNFLHRKELQLLPYYAKHDIKHILLQYDTTDEGEVCLQCFMLGNRHFSFPVAATVLYGLVTMPEYRKSFNKAYHRGKKSISIKNWQWHLIVWEPTEALRKKIYNNVNNTQ